jgi:ferritin
MMSREGFEKLFRKLSDSAWDDAIDLIKYITKRGGTMEFPAHVPVKEELVRHTWFFLVCQVHTVLE